MENGPATRVKAVAGLVLRAATPLPCALLLRHRAAQYAALNARIRREFAPNAALNARIRREFAPIYRRRDMLGAFLFHAAALAGGEIAIDATRRAVIERDEESGRATIAIRKVQA